MDQRFECLGFSPADILLPLNCDLQKWAVVACDQYTSQPEYWERVERFVGQAPSALHLVLPESCLDGPDVENDIMEINTTMSRYLRSGQFRTLPDALVYVERTLADGRVRRGLVGKADLERYDYEPGSKSLIRATEETVASRVPPRVAVRKNAPIELPHVMLLCDDPMETVLGPLAGQRSGMEKLYDFDLMEESGHVTGWLLTDEQQSRVADALDALRGDGEDALLFSVGDGNHSLAAAKESYERQKRLTPASEWEALPARWALVELCNLHDPAISFTPIHRVVFDVDPEHLLQEIGCKGENHNIKLRCVAEGKEHEISLCVPKGQLPAAVLQTGLDAYTIRFGGRVDYIHGEEVAERLAARPRTAAIFLPALEKETLFPAIRAHGALPRKTFSVGGAQDKRFYLEARKIR